jgi:sulfatase maturation enzyme AslB (radical SAM superfamily)
MKIQTLSIVVPRPGKKCINNCPFCVSRMRETEYDLANSVSIGRNLQRRLQFARDNGCNTMIITGEGEALQNKDFLENLRHYNLGIKDPFQWIELQTTGVLLDDKNLDFMENIGVSTIALSVADIWDDVNNNRIIGTPPKGYINLEELCKKIKDHGFNLRLSINMISEYDTAAPAMTMKRAKNLGADQVIFREFYTSENDSEENTWIENNKCSDETIERFNKYILKYGKALERLPFGAMRYSLNGISTVLDSNCMASNGDDLAERLSKDGEETIRYLILRPNGKLYTKWDDKGSLIF